MTETPGEMAADVQREGKTIPLYVQIAALVRQRIYAAEWKRGDILPSEIALRDAYGVSQYVVRQALGMLRAEGLIVTVHGLGSRVEGAPSRVRVKARSGDEVGSRMPTPAERAQLRIPEGVPVTVVRHPDGKEEIYDALRTAVVMTP